LCALGVWLFFSDRVAADRPTIVVAFASPDVMSGRASIDETLALIQFQSFLDRLSPNTLFGEAVIGLLNPETRTLGPSSRARCTGRSWARRPWAKPAVDRPQITGLIAGTIVVFAAAYLIFSARSQSLKDWTPAAALNNATLVRRGLPARLAAGTSARIGSMPCPCRLLSQCGPRWRTIEAALVEQRGPSTSC